MSATAAANANSLRCPLCGAQFEPVATGQTHCRTCSWPCSWCDKPLHHHNHKALHGAQPRVPCLGLLTWYLPVRGAP